MKNFLPTLTRYFDKKVLLFILILVLGFGLGLTWGWVIDPVEWANVEPAYLSDQYKEEYFRMTVDSYRLTFEDAEAMRRLDTIKPDVERLFTKVNEAPGTIDPNFMLIFGKFLTENGYLASGQVPETATVVEEQAPAEEPVQENNTVVESDSASGNGMSTVVVIFASIFAIGLSGFAIFYILRRRSRSFEAEFDDEEQYDEPEYEEPVSHRKFATPLARETHRREETRTVTVEENNEKLPFARYQSTYTIGKDDFNESYSIDSRGGAYLGECGFGVSEFMGVGTPKKATAFEVWMFDKNDIQTVTKVLMTPFLFNDFNARSRMESKGELIEVKPGKQIRLETATLFMIATISDMKFGEGISAEKSYLDQITMDLSIWQK